MKKIMAHRGARNLWAENSLTGFRNVLALEIDSVEFDLHLSDAGQILVIHDASLDRTTTGSGNVRALDDAGRRAVRLKKRTGHRHKRSHPDLLRKLLDVSRNAPGRASLYRAKIRCRR
ncbi:hypothetical protein JS562_55530 [Agrobacterium sp. S2]|nr:hypothetical protein [Agrobacterium sp. S2]